MEIINKSSTNLTKMDIYQMTKSPEIGKMKTAEGQTLEIAAWVVYKDIDKDGVEHTVLSIRTADGDTYATNSGTFIRAFNECIDIFGEDFRRVKISSGVSRNGRTYLTAVAV